ncbi:hypothetical protein [Rhizobium sp. BT03]|uniref:hypothetical protein n=1 Tax=Rhizobium sp. BT03 TaxID=3045156 RepID=UPI0024B3D59D|nr:hypothetical protein [Rhizobium sp. BT03]WHO72460.1 hypothetical protein QMO80_001483 [Rhizobium sp. BT03]
MIPTIFAGNTGRTQGDIDDKRKQLAYAMLQQGMDASPVQSPWQGVAQLAQALMGGLAIRQQDEEQQADTAGGNAVPTSMPSASPAKSSGFLSSLFDGNKIPVSDREMRTTSRAGATPIPNTRSNRSTWSIER